MSDRQTLSHSLVARLLRGAFRRREAAPHVAAAPETAAVQAIELDEIARFVRAFGLLVEGMEERFVPLGQDMGNIVRQLQALAQTAGDGFGSIRREVSGGTLGELDSHAGAAIDHIKQQLSGVSQRMQPLADVADDLHRLRSLGNEVRRIGAFLLACGSSFAVESARREESRTAFAAFVQELRGLANQIGELAERMNEDSQATLSQLTIARRRIRDSVTELDRLAHAMQGAFSHAAGEIEQLLGDLRGVLDRVEQHRAAISAQTGGVIYYLQFGDIVRQKCEHVLAAAREAQDAADRSPQTLPVIIQTAAVQLEIIQHEVDEARQKLAEGYAGLEGELGRLADCGRALSDAGRVDSGDAWTRLKQRLHDLHRIQQQEARLNADAMRSAGEAGAAAAALHASLGSVREMSTHLHLLALNAIIQTAHLGIHGRTLEELAQHVDSLHRTCEALVPRVLDVLEGVGRRVSDFTSQAAQARRAFDLDGVQQLERAQHGSQSVMAEVLTLAAAGEDLLRGAVSRLSTLNTLSGEIDTHRRALLQIASHLPAPAPQAAGEAQSFDERMLQRYTMQSEREAHQRARGLAPAAVVTGAAAAADDIELFDTLPEAAPGAEPAAASVGAGEDDNIELF